ncbi:MAG TPA: hypothetical protein VGD99_20430 [Anaerolineae bacterium]|jgi:hypothetical protein
MERSQAQTVRLNHRQNNTRTYPELVRTSALTEREATYYAALDLVAYIDEALKKGTCHYRNKAGLLLTTLDEVVRAILDDDLMLEEQEEAEIMWAQELAA